MLRSPHATVITLPVLVLDMSLLMFSALLLCGKPALAVSAKVRLLMAVNAHVTLAKVGSYVIIQRSTGFVNEHAL